MSVPARPTFWRECCLLGGLLLVFFAAGSGLRPLANPDEGRYAEIPREMVATGDWVTPRLNGVKYFEKPPLGYWMVAVAERVLGPGEASVRLMPVLSAWLGCLATFVAARALYGRRTAWLAAIILATSLLYFAMSQILLLDMLVSALITGALFSFILAVRMPPGPGRRFTFYGVYLFAALATLAKGLIGFLLPGAVMFLWLLLYRQWRRLRPLYLPTGIALFLAVAVPWHWMVISRNSDFAWFYFVHEHFLRFTTDVNQKVEPWWYFLAIVAAGMLPWTGLLWPALSRPFARQPDGKREHTLEGFFLIWAGFILMFFSISHSKLVPYIVPVLPPLAVLIGRECAEIWDGGNWRRTLRIGAAITLGLMALLAFALLVGPRFATVPGQAEALRPFAYGGCAAILIAVIAGGLALRARQGRRLISSLAVGGSALILVLVLASATIQKPGTRELVGLIQARPDREAPVFTYGEFFHDLPYYLQRKVQVVDFRGELAFGIDAEPDNEFFMDKEAFRQRWETPEPAFLVVSRDQAEPLLEDPRFQHSVVGANTRILLLSNQVTL